MLNSEYSDYSFALCFPVAKRQEVRYTPIKPESLFWKERLPPTITFLLFFFSFLLATASRTALGPTQPPIQWVPGALSLGVKRPGREADHSPPSSAEVKE
jgi:hypothetical protein